MGLKGVGRNHLGDRIDLVFELLVRADARVYPWPTAYSLLVAPPRPVVFKRISQHPIVPGLDLPNPDLHRQFEQMHIRIESFVSHEQQP